MKSSQMFKLSIDNVLSISCRLNNQFDKFSLDKAHLYKIYHTGRSSQKSWSTLLCYSMLTVLKSAQNARFFYTRYDLFQGKNWILSKGPFFLLNSLTQTPKTAQVMRKSLFPNILRYLCVRWKEVWCKRSHTIH
jgi:hypothetical protein